MPSFVAASGQPAWRQGRSADAGPGLPPASAAPAAAPSPAASVPVPAASASADPAYLAYLRGVGVEESELGNVLNTRVGALTRQLGRGLPAYAERQKRAVESAGNYAESRGLYRSGMRMRDQFRAASDVDRQRMDFEQGIRDQIAELYATNAADVAARRRQLAEQGINGAQAVTLANAQAGIY